MRASMASLRVFTTVAEVGSIRVAAERLGRTPSSISEQLKSLEEEVGAVLFETGRKNRLTAAGAFVHAQARDLLQHYERTLAAVQAFTRNAIGRVDMASVPSIATTMLPAVITGFRERWPAVEITVRDADSRSVADLVQAGTVELGFASLPSERRAIAFEPLFDEPLGIVCRRDDPLYLAGTAQRWDALEGRTMLANAIPHGHAVETARPSASAAPIVVYNVLSLIALVEARIGVTILPRLAVMNILPAIGFVPIADADARRTVGAITRAGETLSPAAARFLQLFREELATAAGRFGVTLRNRQPGSAKRPRAASR